VRARQDFDAGDARPVDVTERRSSFIRKAFAPIYLSHINGIIQDSARWTA